MKLILVSTMLMLSGAFELHPEETHDHVQMGSDVDNLRMRLDCALDKIPCDYVNAIYVEQFPISLKNACATCKYEAKITLYAFLKAISEYFPEDYVLFVKKYDPEGKYFDNLLKVLAQA